MKKLAILLLMICLTSCKTDSKTISMDTIAEKYVRLVLEIGQYDSDFVDAYFGPESYKPAGVKEEIFPSDIFVQRADSLIQQCDALLASKKEILEPARIQMMKKQLLATRTKVEMLGGKSYTFDEEAKLIYDAEPPHFTNAYFDSLLVNFEKILPGEGDLSERYNSYMTQFVIPNEKLDTVFQLVIAEARRITKSYFELPENENFVLEYVTGKVWGGYNYYQGNSQSLIQINTDFPTYIDRAVDVGCHEGYPGHHVFMTLMEQNLVDKKGWVEFSVYPLFSPLSLIAEGSANYGIDVVFPGNKRVEFEREYLFPLAGIDVSKADKFYEVQKLKGQLGYAGNEVAREYLNGSISKDDAAKRIEKYLFSTPEKALQYIGFIETYRSYVINYNVGKRMVTKHVALSGGTADNPEKRWEVFKELLSNPYTASTLKQ